MRVAILDDYDRVAKRCADWSALERRAELVTFADHVDDPADLIQRLAGFEVVVAMRERTAFPAVVFDGLPGLRLLVTTGTVNAAIDLAAAKRHHVTVCTAPGTGGSAAELTWGLLLALVRQIPASDAATRADGWHSSVGMDLAGHTLGILGLGRLGECVARYGHAFQMQVLAWSEHLSPERASACGAQRVSKEELFRASDVVSIHVRLSERTRGLVGAHELELLGPAGYLVNTARGPIVDEADLVHALTVRGIAGAALDVFDREPLPLDHPLRATPNTILTPHIGYTTFGSYGAFYRNVIEDIEKWLDGSPVRVRV